MLKNEMKVVKDGSKIRVIVKSVDTSAPPVRIEGHIYKFNSEIVADKSLSAYEFSQAMGFNFNKGDIEWKE